ncbi:hypothetical protein Q671_06575 [Halomonas sp. PBN3]|nr:hypothetical protein Q671_06575 [Halomonas sp. PBN3]
MHSPRALRSWGSRAAWIRALTGVATPASRPRRTTAPFWDSSSEGRPAMMSRCMEAVLASGRASMKPIARVSASAGRAVPRALATAAISARIASISSRVSGRRRVTPMGARVRAPMPLMAQMNRNLLHTAA